MKIFLAFPAGLLYYIEYESIMVWYAHFARRRQL